jgi:hypothetical protein
LTPERRAQFGAAALEFVADLKQGNTLRAGSRIKRLQGSGDVWECAWASNGRALFRYGTSPHPGDIHIKRERVGARDIYER